MAAPTGIGLYRFLLLLHALTNYQPTCPPSALPINRQNRRPTSTPLHSVNSRPCDRTSDAPPAPPTGQLNSGLLFRQSPGITRRPAGTSAPSAGDTPLRLPSSSHPYALAPLPTQPPSSRPSAAHAHQHADSQPADRPTHAPVHRVPLRGHDPQRINPLRRFVNRAPRRNPTAHHPAVKVSRVTPLSGAYLDPHPRDT